MSICLANWRQTRLALRDVPRELWLTLGPLRFLCAVSYYTFTAIFVGYMEMAYRLDDRTSWWYFGVWGGANTIFAFLGGWVCDGLGVRLALVLGGLSSAAGFLALALTTRLSFGYWLSVFVLIPIGVGLGLPVCDVANKRLSTVRNQYLIYPLAYSVSALGQCVGLTALAITAAIYLGQSHRQKTKPLEDGTVERIVLMICAVGSALLAVLSYAIKSSDGKMRRPPSAASVDEDGDGVVLKRTWYWWICSPRAFLRENVFSVVRSSTYARVVLFTVLTLPARHVFILMYTMLAVYLRRTLGGDTPVYAFMLIDPILEWVLAPMFAVFLPQFDIYDMMIVGSAISSVGLLGFVTFEPTYLSVSLTLAAFAIGGAMYVPRIPQYILIASPPGAEGRFAALAATLPISLGKLIVGAVFGSLLEKQCSVHSVDDECARVWIPSVALSFATCASLFVCKRIIHTDEMKRRVSEQLGGASLPAPHVHGSSLLDVALIRMTVS